MSLVVAGAMDMKKILVVACVAVLAGCSPIKARRGGDQVRVTNNEPQGCRYLGDITGSQGNFFTGRYTSNKNLETGARNDLKNKAAAKGGNVVYLLTQRAGQSGHFVAQTNVTLSGNVYYCP
jgi:hypothetical protein